MSDGAEKLEDIPGEKAGDMSNAQWMRFFAARFFGLGAVIIAVGLVTGGLCLWYAWFRFNQIAALLEAMK